MNQTELIGLVFQECVNLVEKGKDLSKYEVPKFLDKIQKTIKKYECDNESDIYVHNKDGSINMKMTFDNSPMKIEYLTGNILFPISSELTSGPFKMLLNDEFYRATVGIGKDNIATLLIDKKALLALRDLKKEPVIF